MPTIKFKMNQLVALNDDFRASKNALPVIVQKVLRQKLAQVKNRLRAQVARNTGALRSTIGYTPVRIDRKKGFVSVWFGLLLNRKWSASQTIRGNVMIHGSGTHGTRTGSKYMWIPLGANRGANGMPVISPREFLDSGGQVVTSKAGNRIAIRRPMSAPFFVLRERVQVKPQIDIPTAVEAALPEIMANIPVMIQQVIAARKAAVAALQ